MKPLHPTGQNTSTNNNTKSGENKTNTITSLFNPDQTQTQTTLIYEAKPTTLDQWQQQNPSYTMRVNRQQEQENSFVSIFYDSNNSNHQKTVYTNGLCYVTEEICKDTRDDTKTIKTVYTKTAPETIVPVVTVEDKKKYAGFIANVLEFFSSSFSFVKSLFNNQQKTEQIDQTAQGSISAMTGISEDDIIAVCKIFDTVVEQKSFRIIQEVATTVLFRIANMNETSEEAVENINNQLNTVFKVNFYFQSLPALYIFCVMIHNYVVINTQDESKNSIKQYEDYFNNMQFMKTENEWKENMLAQYFEARYLILPKNGNDGLGGMYADGTSGIGSTKWNSSGYDRVIRKIKAFVTNHSANNVIAAS